MKVFVTRRKRIARMRGRNSTTLVTTAPGSSKYVNLVAVHEDSGCRLWTQLQATRSGVAQDLCGLPDCSQTAAPACTVD